MKTGANVVGIAIGIIVLSIGFAVIERVFGRGRERPFFRRGWWVDICYWFFTPLVSKTLSRLALALPIGLLVWFGVVSLPEVKAGRLHGFGPLSSQPVWLQAIEIYLVADLIGYWSHRLFHGGRWWPFHAVHHSSEDLDWMSSVRLHPLNDLVRNSSRSRHCWFWASTRS